MVRLLVVALLGGVVFATNTIDLASLFPSKVFSYEKIDDVGLPKIVDSTKYLVNPIGRFTYLYSTNHKQAEWVAYRLTRDDLQGQRVKRTDRFIPDKEVVSRNWLTATTDDYYKSSFDRGHLLPSADRNASRAENRETFNLSNISPQKSALNRNAWADLEQQVRDWALRYDTLYVVTGGVFKGDSLGYIGENRVTVPERFFKVVMSVREGRYNAIGFVLPNSTQLRDDYMGYSMNINRVERITGIDFFDNMPDPLEQAMERRVNKLFWR